MLSGNGAIFKAITTDFYWPATAGQLNLLIPMIAFIGIVQILLFAINSGRKSGFLQILRIMFQASIGKDFSAF